MTLSIDPSLYERLTTAAAADRRSPKAQALVLLERGLGLRRGDSDALPRDVGRPAEFPA